MPSVSLSLILFELCIQWCPLEVVFSLSHAKRLLLVCWLKCLLAENLERDIGRPCMPYKQITIVTQHSHLVPAFVLCVHRVHCPGSSLGSLRTTTHASLVAVDEPLGAISDSLVPLLGAITSIVMVNS